MRIKCPFKPIQLSDILQIIIGPGLRKQILRGMDKIYTFSFRPSHNIITYLYSNCHMVSLLTFAQTAPSSRQTVCCICASSNGPNYIMNFRNFEDKNVYKILRCDNVNDFIALTLMEFTRNSKYCRDRRYF